MRNNHEHVEFQGAYTARKGFKKCVQCLSMYVDPIEIALDRIRWELKISRLEDELNNV